MEIGTFAKTTFAVSLNVTFTLFTPATIPCVAVDPPIVWMDNVPGDDAVTVNVTDPVAFVAQHAARWPFAVLVSMMTTRRVKLKSV